MGSNYVRIQSYAADSNAAHQHVDDLDTDVALSNVVCFEIRMWCVSCTVGFFVLPENMCPPSIRGLIMQVDVQGRLGDHHLMLHMLQNDRTMPGLLQEQLCGLRHQLPKNTAQGRRGRRPRHAGHCAATLADLSVRGHHVLSVAWICRVPFLQTADARRHFGAARGAHW